MEIEILKGHKLDNTAPQSLQGLGFTPTGEFEGQSLPGRALRNAASLTVNNLPLIASRFNPAVGGALLGGELLQGASNLASNYLPQVPQGLQDFLYATSGHMTPQRLAQAQGAENPEQYQQNVLDYLPTGANISRGLAPYLPEGYLQPQSDTERALHDFATFAGHAYSPVLGGAPSTLGQAATRGGLAAAGGHLARSAGLEGLPETLTKIGFSSLPELAKIFTAPGIVKQQVTQDYDITEGYGSHIPVRSEGIKSKIEPQIAEAKKLSKNSINDAIQENGQRLIDLADEQGFYTAADLVKFKQSMNKLWGKGSNEVIHKINAPILEELDKVGQQFPQFGNAFNAAEEGFKALNTAGIVQNFIKKVIPKETKYGAIGFGIKALISGEIGTAAALASAKPIAQGSAKFIDFVTRSSQAQKILGNMIKNIVSDAKEPAIKDYNRLNKLYEKEIKLSEKTYPGVEIIKGHKLNA